MNSRRAGGGGGRSADGPRRTAPNAGGGSSRAGGRDPGPVNGGCRTGARQGTGPDGGARGEDQSGIGRTADARPDHEADGDREPRAPVRSRWRRSSPPAARSSKPTSRERAPCTRPRSERNSRSWARATRSIKVKLRDGREGWIIESCIQVFSKSETVKKIVYSGISGADQGNFLKVADGIFARLVQNKLFADEIAASFAAREDLPPQDKIQMVARAERIRGYFTPAADTYNLYLAGQSAAVMEGRKFSEALSGWANLLLGSANYGAQILSGASSSENGMTIDLSAGGSLELNPSSKLDLSVAQLSDVIDTPYSSTTVGAGYDFRGSGGLNARAAASYNAYSDSAESGNSYGRITLSGSGGYRLSEKTDLNLDYAFMNHAYNEAGNDGYSSHAIRFGGLFRPTASSQIAFHLRANLESSESEFHQFTNLEPAVSYEKTMDNGRFAIGGRMEMFTFGDAEENNFSRTQLEVTSERSNRDILTTLDGGLAFKSFPE